MLHQLLIFCIAYKFYNKQFKILAFQVVSSFIANILKKAKDALIGG